MNYYKTFNLMKLKATVFKPPAHIFSESSYFKLEFGIKQLISLLFSAEAHIVGVLLKHVHKLSELHKLWEIEARFG